MASKFDNQTSNTRASRREHVECNTRALTWERPLDTTFVYLSGIHVSSINRIETGSWRHLQPMTTCSLLLENALTISGKGMRLWNMCGWCRARDSHLFSDVRFGLYLVNTLQRTDLDTPKLNKKVPKTLLQWDALQLRTLHIIRSYYTLQKLSFEFWSTDRLNSRRNMTIDCFTSVLCCQLLFHNWNLTKHT